MSLSMEIQQFAYAKTKAQISFAVHVTAKLIIAFFRNTDSTIPILSKSKISSIYPSSATLQPVLCRSWSEPKLLVLSRTGTYVRFQYHHLGAGTIYSY